MLTQKIRFAVLLFFISFSTQANDVVDELYLKLKNTHVNYHPLGAVCEQAAKLELEKIYPEPYFEVKTNITYLNHGKVAGELDVVVFEKPSGEGVLVGEVKCRHNLHEALRKAESQKKRFLAILKRSKHLDFYSHDDHPIDYSKKHFSPSIQFVTFSQEGGKSAGFDFSLDYTLDELLEVRSRLLVGNIQTLFWYE